MKELTTDQLKFLRKILNAYLYDTRTYKDVQSKILMVETKVKLDDIIEEREEVEYGKTVNN